MTNNNLRGLPAVSPWDVLDAATRGEEWVTFGELKRAREQLAADLAAAIARAEAAERDAARWRWLREHFRFANDSMHELWFDASLEPNDSAVPADLDQEIDIEIAAQQAEGEA